MLATALRTTSRRQLAFALALLLGLGLSLDSSSPNQGSVTRDPVHATQYAPNRARLPLSFERNAGQADAQARYLVHSAGGVLLFTPSEVIFSLSASRPSFSKNLRSFA